ncbi:unnamed protein product [Spirodela intermedia]|uniref:Uncharacterized protein n=1 Tax=Spirodela intermedia TaxID=51605 RepID=A0A7I8J6M9_SPIIN|nr:unnamed protein product [Spirodela intermedia]CAA6665897.1 unnamed protein product [Spirodela intermedia]
MNPSSRVDRDGDGAGNVWMSHPSLSSMSPIRLSSDTEMSFGERSVAAAGAAVLSAVLVNPLDVAKTRLQAQAAGVPYYPYEPYVRRHIVSLGQTRYGDDLNIIFSDIRCSTSCTRGGIFGTEMVCPPDCFQYKGTLDVFHKIIRQEGFTRLWRGTNAALALAIPTVKCSEFDTIRPLVSGSVARSLACIACSPIELARTRMQAFKEFKSEGKPPGVLKTLLGVLSPLRNTSNLQNIQNFRVLWTGVGAQLARDVPFSAICWSTLEPIRRKLLGIVGEEATAASVLGANFSAGFVAGSIAAAVTCPLDVVKTRRQIEKDPSRALNMTTRQVLADVWSSGRTSVGIVVSFYEVVKHVLHQRHSSHDWRGLPTKNR